VLLDAEPTFVEQLTQHISSTSRTETGWG